MIESSDQRLRQRVNQEMREAEIAESGQEGLSPEEIRLEVIKKI